MNNSKLFGLAVSVVLACGVAACGSSDEAAPEEEVGTGDGDPEPEGTGTDEGAVSSAKIGCYYWIRTKTPGSNVNVRSDPNMRAAISGKVYDKQGVGILGQPGGNGRVYPTNGFFRLNIPCGAHGCAWVAQQYVRKDPRYNCN